MKEVGASILFVLMVASGTIIIKDSNKDDQPYSLMGTVTAIKECYPVNRVGRVAGERCVIAIQHSDSVYEYYVIYKSPQFKLEGDIVYKACFKGKSCENTPWTTTVTKGHERVVDSVIPLKEVVPPSLKEDEK